MKFATDPPYADPEAAARKLVRLAKSVKTIQGGRIYIAEIKEPFYMNTAVSTDMSRASNGHLNAGGFISMSPERLSGLPKQAPTCAHDEMARCQRCQPGARGGSAQALRQRLLHRGALFALQRSGRWGSAVHPDFLEIEIDDRLR
jgi:hypothetical protein